MHVTAARATNLVLLTLALVHGQEAAAEVAPAVGRMEMQAPRRWASVGSAPGVPSDRIPRALKRRASLEDSRQTCFVPPDHVRTAIARAMRIFPRLADRRGPRGQSEDVPPFELVHGDSHPDWPLVAECSTERAMPDWRTVLPDANARGFGSEKSSRVYEGIRIPAKVAEHWPDQWLREGFRRIEQTHHGARWRILDVPLYVNYISNDAYKCSALHTTDTNQDRIDALVHSLEATPPDERRNLVVVMTGWKRASPYNGTRTGMRLLSLLVSLNATLLTVDTFFALKMQQEWAWKHTLVVPYAPHRTLGARTDPPPALHQRTLVAYIPRKDDSQYWAQWAHVNARARAPLDGGAPQQQHL